MNNPFEIIDPPELIEVVPLRIEDCSGSRTYRRFSHFRWRGEDFWILGTMVWRNSLQSGRVRLRLPRGRKLFSTSIGVRPDACPPQFAIQRPREWHCEKAAAFVFEGFSEGLLVNIDFVREEDRRWSEFHEKFKGAEPRIAKPPKGSLV